MPEFKEPDFSSMSEEENKEEKKETYTKEEVENLVAKIRSADEFISQLNINDAHIIRLKKSGEKKRIKEACEGSLNVIAILEELLQDKEVASHFSDEEFGIIKSKKKHIKGELEKIEDKE